VVARLPRSLEISIVLPLVVCVAAAQSSPQEIAILEAADAAAFDHLGFSAAVDGDTVVVGAYLEGTGPSNPGAAYVFARDHGGPNAWDQVAKLTASDGSDADQFGISVAVSGDTALVGAWFDDDAGPQCGSAYVFQRDQGGADNWGQVAKLTAADAAAADLFGISVALSGDRALIGARLDDDGGAQSGSAYLFERNVGGADNWGEAKKLTASGATGGEWFGQSVALAGERAVVGALTTASIGSAHVFERDHGGSGNWGEVADLTPSDGVGGNQFGFTVALSSDTVVVGANATEGVGAAYVYDRDEGGAGNWGEVARLDPADGAGGDSFGRVAIAGDLVLVGAPGSGVAGAAYTFGRDQNGPDQWGQMARFGASGGASGEQFGHSVGLSGSAAVVGAPDCAAQGLDAGAAYVFDWITAQPSPLEVAQLTGHGSSPNDGFGWSVQVDGDTVAVGANTDDEIGNAAGAFYVFGRDEGGPNRWGEVRKVFAPDGPGGRRFGFDVALEGNTIVAGAPYDDTNGPTSGAAYVLERDLGGANNWGGVAKLFPSDPASATYFGRSVAVAGDTALIAAPFGGPGAVYVFERDLGGPDNWGQSRKVVASNGSSGDGFGLEVAVHGDTALVGTAWAEAAYVFERNFGGGGNWGERKILTGSNSTAGAYFGWSVGLSGDHAVVGAPYDDDQGFSNSGSAFLFERDLGGSGNWGEAAKLLASGAENSAFVGLAAAIEGDVALVGSAPNSLVGSAYVFWRDQGASGAWAELSHFTASGGMRFGAYVDLSGQTGVGGTESSTGAFVFEPLLAVTPTTYCTAGISASGCQAQIAASGTPSATADSGFDLIATNFEGEKKGIFFFGANGRQANSWGNGSSYQCVVPPVKRGALLDSGGAAGTCDGQVVYDLNARWTSLPSQNPGAGALVQAQLWYRDPFNTSNQSTSLSNAIEFSICP
jgi:hypothetical protein